MNIFKYKNFISGTLRELSQSLWTKKGSVLVYLIVVLLIFGVLGVTMVSLFTTATSSSATPNNARRADYASESGIRYAFSELRNSDFATATIDRLNSTDVYTLDTGQTFSVNVFGPWFEATSDQVLNSGDTLSLTVPEGKIPSGFTIPNGLWLVNYDYLDLTLTSARVHIDGWSKIDDTTLTITLGGDFTVNTGERVCLAVKPFGDPAPIGEGGNLDVQLEAKDFFPENDGAININRFDYVYKKRVVESDRVRLENISASSMPNGEPPPSPLDVSPGDFIVLSPRNHIVIPTGTADTVTVAGTLNTALNIYDTSTVKSEDTSDLKPLVTNFNQLETNPDFISSDTVDNTIDVGGGEALAANPQFGSAWFNADKNIGGKQGVCNAGKCEFGIGVRVFFTLDYSGTADGLTFALINAANNTATSSGGDINMGELLAYGGDSRKVYISKDSTTSTANFLDFTGASLSPPHPGLHPPKMALEFDTYTNRSTLKDCQDSTQLYSSRNDPFDHNRDAVQYVFWGFNSLTMPCRDYWLSGTHVVDHGSYDDNRHDSGELDQFWRYTTLGPVRSTPTVAADGTIYVGSDDGHLYAINPDGSLKWKSVNIGQVKSSPAIGLNGVVYVGTNNDWVYGFAKDAVDPSSHAVLYSFPAFGAFESSPVIGAGGKVYVGSDDGIFYGLTPSLVKEWKFQIPAPISYGRPAIGPTGIIYVTSRADVNSRVYALNPAQRELDPTGVDFPRTNEWAFDIGDGSHYMPGIDLTTGTIYSDRLNNKIVAITPGGAQDWVFDLGSDIDSTPVVGSDGTVYVGADNGKLYAINPQDRKNGEIFPVSGREWTFSQPSGTLRTIPAIAPDGTILVVSYDDILYAVNPDGTKKWTFPIPVDGSEPTSSPTVDNEGVVYVGSSDNKLYAINNFAEPRNFKDKVVTSVYDGSDVRVAGEIVTVDDELDWLDGNKIGSDPKGPWAVRMEVMRSQTQNANSKYEYTLHAWIRQCDSADCGNIFGTFYADTRIEYAATPHLAQTIELTPTEHTEFDRFLFGFTGATGSGQFQTAVIADFALSFIRPNDPVAND